MIKVKVCGITNIEDSLAAVEFGADAVGFVFAPSPRQVTPETVKGIVEQLPPFVTKVGVFVDSQLSHVKDVISLCNLDLAQLHGSESPDFCEELFPKVIKAFNSNNLPYFEDLELYKVSAFMLDREKGSDDEPEQIWPVARQLADYGRVILAGGLNAGNVSEAVRVAEPYAVDVASGVEESPGKKDHAKMKDFIDAAKGR